MNKHYSFSQKFILLILGLIYLMLSNYAMAQIGVDEPNPNKFSILDLKASDKGILIPRMKTTDRSVLLTDCKAKSDYPSSLMVYDTDLNSFFYLIDTVWYAMTPFKTPDSDVNTAEELVTNDNIVSRIGIGTNPDNAYKLDVNGAIQIRDSVAIATGLVVRTGDLKVNTGNISAPSGNISTTSGNISTSTGKITSKGFSSDTSATGVAGPVPKGGIIMWSGSIASIPKGWSLCDGSNNTPDLRQRFIVGAGGTGTGNYTVGQKGGEAQHTLTISEMPSHDHNGWTNSGGSHSHGYWDHTVSREDVNGSNFNNQGINGVPDDYRTTDLGGDHQHTIPSQGGGNAFENRPPYYALAYIMKL